MISSAGTGDALRSKVQKAALLSRRALDPISHQFLPDRLAQASSLPSRGCTILWRSSHIVSPYTSCNYLCSKAPIAMAVRPKNHGDNASTFRLSLALMAPLLLAVGYLWGVIYRDTRVESWGFHSYAMSMSPQEVYIQAFNAGESVLRWPREWVDATPRWIIYFVLTPGVLVIALLGSTRFGDAIVRWRDRWRERPRRVISERARRAAQWGFHALGVILFWPILLYGSGAVMVFLIAPPLYAAKADAARGWEMADYKKWDTAVWTTSDGEKREGFVYGCNDVDCAILQGDGQAYVVPRGQVSERKGRLFQRARIGGDAAG